MSILERLRGFRKRAHAATVFAGQPLKPEFDESTDFDDLSPNRLKLVRFARIFRTNCGRCLARDAAPDLDRVRD